MIELFEPSGVIKTNPDDMYLENVIFCSDTTYWSSSDDMSITFQCSDGASRLILIHSDKNTFFLEYIPANLKVYDTFVSLNNSIEAGDSICVYVGGEEHQLPSETFVSSEDSMKAIKQFIKDGNKTDRIEWVKRSQLKWPLVEDGEL